MLLIFTDIVWDGTECAVKPEETTGLPEYGLDDPPNDHTQIKHQVNSPRELVNCLEPAAMSVSSLVRSSSI